MTSVICISINQYYSWWPKYNDPGPVVMSTYYSIHYYPHLLFFWLFNTATFWLPDDVNAILAIQWRLTNILSAVDPLIEALNADYDDITWYVSGWSSSNDTMAIEADTMSLMAGSSIQYYYWYRIILFNIWNVYNIVFNLVIYFSIILLLKMKKGNDGNGRNGLKKAKAYQWKYGSINSNDNGLLLII